MEIHLAQSLGASAIADVAGGEAFEIPQIGKDATPPQGEPVFEAHFESSDARRGEVALCGQ